MARVPSTQNGASQDEGNHDLGNWSFRCFHGEIYSGGSVIKRTIIAVLKTSLNNPLTITICGVAVVLGIATYAYFKVPAWRAEQAQVEENAQQQIQQELDKQQASGEAASQAEFCETAAMLAMTLSNTERSLEESAAPDEDGVRNPEALVDLQKTQKLIAHNARDLESCKHQLKR